MIRAVLPALFLLVPAAVGAQTLGEAYRVCEQHVVPPKCPADVRRVCRPSGPKEWTIPGCDEVERQVQAAAAPRPTVPAEAIGPCAAQAVANYRGDSEASIKAGRDCKGW